MLKTFPKGGVHPAENKLSAKSEIKILPVPKQVIIPISMHIGAPAKPVVSKGDKVKAGQKIAESTGFVSANIHSSVSGTISKIDAMEDPGGFKRMSIVIDVEGDEWVETIDKSNGLIKDIKSTPEDILKKIQEAGIVGMGGASFPTHVKLTPPHGKKAELLILNGVECEPYLTSDHRLMLEKTEEILIGTKILMKGMNVSKAIIGIENNKPDAIDSIKQLIKEYPEISVQQLKVQYPQGGEKQLIKALINKEVPSGGLPIDVGVVVQNVGTAYAVYEAVQKNKPLIERVVTLTGKSVKNPSNFQVRIGTPVSELIEAAGGLPEDTGKVISGGPMMGKAISSFQTPVTKGTSGILILNKEESLRRPEANCIRCARCTNACPMGLEPFLLSQLAERALWDRLEMNAVTDCIECGSCMYTCPSQRAILDNVRLGKTTVMGIIRKRHQN